MDFRKHLNVMFFRRGLLNVLGREGYARVLHTFQHLMQWVLCVAILETGTLATFQVFAVLDAPTTIGGMPALTIHHGIAYVGMLGFLISQFLYELDFIVRRLGQIRRSWRDSSKA